jgi:hypothetical protein
MCVAPFALYILYTICVDVHEHTCIKHQKFHPVNIYGDGKLRFGTRGVAICAIGGVAQRQEREWDWERDGITVDEAFAHIVAFRS